MAVAFRSDSDVYGGTSVAKPAGLADGDLVVAILSLYAGSPSAPAAPAGWTRFDLGVTSPVAFGLYYHYVSSAAGEPANYTFTTSYYQVTWVGAFSGADSSSPITVYGRNSASASSPSVNVPSDGSLAIWWQAADAVVGATAQPAGFTTQSNGDGAIIATKAAIAAGATGTFTGGGVQTFTGVIIVNPSAGGGGGASSDPIEGAGRRALQRNANYRMTPRSEREAQEYLRARKGQKCRVAPMRSFSLPLL